MSNNDRIANTYVYIGKIATLRGKKDIKDNFSPENTVHSYTLRKTPNARRSSKLRSVTPVRSQRRYVFLALTHRYEDLCAAGLKGRD